MLIEAKHSVFWDAVRNSCRHLHGVAQHSYKKGLGHLYDAVELMERQCKTVENTANTQLRAMGSDEYFRRLWSFPGENPFATQPGTIPQILYGSDVDQPIHVSRLCLIYIKVDVFVCNVTCFFGQILLSHTVWA